MNFSVDGGTADQLWVKLRRRFETENTYRPSRQGAVLEVPGTVLSLTDPTQRWITGRNPPINVAFALAEVVWILGGRRDADFLTYFNRQLPRYAGTGTNFHGAYGFRLRKRLGFDQLQRAYDVLRRNPESRQVVLQLWDGTVDFPLRSGAPVAADVPCNVVSMLKIREGALDWTQVMRSNDLFRGLPYNVVQFTSMQEILAGWLGVRIGIYRHYCDSLHVYERDTNDVRRVPGKPGPRNLDRLGVSRRDTERCIDELVRFTLSAIRRTPARKIVVAVRNTGLPPSYKNIAAIIGAEALRRRGAPAESGEVAAECANQTFRFMYGRWLERLAVGVQAPM